MQRESVTSSNVASIGYEESTNILEVEFNNGSIYHYYDIPLYEYEELMNAESKGKYLDAFIKKEAIDIQNNKEYCFNIEVID